MARLDPRKTKGRKLKYLYGITIEEYEALLEAQGGVCAVCKRPQRKVAWGAVVMMSVDHDHKTGVVRGLLCYHCNAGLGFFDDDPELLEAAVGYLKGVVKGWPVSA